MSVRETALQFACEGESLLGIVSHPAGRPASIGMVIVVGGPQYRIGSHRQFVLLARALAAAGHAVLRFDCRGMGDSSGAAPGFNAIDADIGAAIGALQTACPMVQKVALWGLCDGASAALLYAQRTGDRRLAGLGLANPWMHTEQAEAHAIVHTYYRQRLLDGAFWRKVARGGVNPVRKLREFLRHRRDARRASSAGDATVGMREALDEIQLPLLLLLCTRDATAQAFLAQLALGDSRLLAKPHVRRADFAEADHTFSSGKWRREVENATIVWLKECCS
jgi:exosortase A-associated hydrolase 1